MAAAKYFDLEIFEDISNPIGFNQPQVELDAVEIPSEE